MPTTKPRLALTLPDDLKATLDAFAEATGRPTSSAIVALLTELQPQLEGLTKVLKSARQGNVSAAKRHLTHMFGDTLGELMQHQLELPATKARKK